MGQILAPRSFSTTLVRLLLGCLFDRVLISSFQRTISTTSLAPSVVSHRMQRDVMQPLLPTAEYSCLEGSASFSFVASLAPAYRVIQFNGHDVFDDVHILDLVEQYTSARFEPPDRR